MGAKFCRTKVSQLQFRIHKSLCDCILYPFILVVLLPISNLQIHHSLKPFFFKKENFEFLLRVDCVFLCGKNLKAHQSGLGCGRAICLTKKRIVTPVRDSMLLLHPSGLAHQFLLQWKNARGARASDFGSERMMHYYHRNYYFCSSLKQEPSDGLLQMGLRSLSNELEKWNGPKLSMSV